MPAGDRTRPTTDRVREAVFSSLVVWAGSADRSADEALAGLAFLDLYAGSGAVGLEAASRGANPVLLVEADRRTAELVGRNARQLGLGVAVRPERVERALANGAERPWDVIWLDPPYEEPTENINELLNVVVNNGWLAVNGLVIMERPTRGAAPASPTLAETWSRRYGETTIYYAMRGERV